MTFYTAQRVLSSGGEQGINAFRRVANAPPASEAPVEAEHIEVRPGGNRVQSYLDVTAPSSLSVEIIIARIKDYAAQEEKPNLPARIGLPGMQIVFGCNFGMESDWRGELKALAEALALLP